MNDARVGFQRPEDAGDRTGSGYGLPADLLRQSRRRIRVVALLVLLGAGLDTVLMLGAVVAWMLGSARPDELPSALPLAANLLSVASALTLAIAAGNARIRDTALLKLALAFEVFLCLILSLSNPVSVYETTGGLPSLTWVTPLIIMFPLIVPCPPRRTLLTALLAAATRPLGILILAAGGRIEAGVGDYLTAAFGPTIGVVIAYFGSRVVYGLGIEVAHARRMGSYVLERILGRGGMGEVWLARHRMLARPAAVKLVRPDIHGSGGPWDARTVLERFEREAQATAALSSPHTIDLYDFGVTEEGTFYYVMELLDGLDLDSLIRRFGPVPPARAVWILRQVCHSLAEAHEAGLIHRDIKPANIYLCHYGRDFDFVKVLDFGLVKMTGADHEIMLTAQGAFGGTPAFASPEQARGSEHVDARSDIYAVGCLAYWLLTGQPVFEARSPIEVLMHHVQTAPVRPSGRSETPVPEIIEGVVMACLEKDPERRPGSAAELASLLEPALATGDWTNERARDWWLAHRPNATA